MEELQLTLTPSRVDQRNQGIMLANWRVGQMINALVTERMPNGGLLLSVGSQSFITSSDIPAQPGSRIQLEVHQMEPKLVLRLINHSSASATYRTGAILANGNPNNAGKTEANSLASLFKGTDINLNSASLNASDIKTLLASNSLTPGAINASSVQAAIMLSGVFTEALWLSSKPSLGAKSTKTILMIFRQRIAAALESPMLNTDERAALGRLLRNAESALASITHQQILSLPEDDERRKWVTTLPLLLDEEICEIDVEIQRRARPQDDRAQWKLRFSLTLEELGTVTVFIEVHNGRVRIDFTMSSSVSARVANLMPALRNQLVSEGLSVESISTSEFDSESKDPVRSRVNVSV